MDTEKNFLLVTLPTWSFSSDLNFGRSAYKGSSLSTDMGALIISADLLRAADLLDHTDAYIFNLLQLTKEHQILAAA